MFKFIKLALAVFDSTPFLIFFAAWTGIYLVQVIKKEQAGPGVDELWWIILFFAIGIFIV